jgi:hypothetical protein
MSFTAIVKDEASKLPLDELTNISELSAVVNASYIDDEIIKINTENASIARRIHNLLKEVFVTVPSIEIKKNASNNKSVYNITIQENVSDILEKLGIVLNKHPQPYIVDDEELSRAYIRGLFLMTGSINDPKKSRYHLEMTVNTSNYASFICELLNNYNLGAKYIPRDNKFMIYLKEAEKIGDFLRIIGTNNAVLYYEDIRIYRDHKNMTNRLNNCEQANIDKTIITATNQIKNIHKIVDKIGLDLLDEKIREAIEYRLKYPESSLLELSEIMSIELGKKITKSGLYHRLNKIKDLVKNIE